MTAATVDFTNKGIGSEEEYASKLTNAIGLDSKIDYEKESASNYYYSVGSFNFALGKGFKPETLENVNLTTVPFVPKWYLGIVSIHGLIIPVIDLVSFGNSQKMGISESKTNKHYLLKLEHKDFNPIIFKIDNLPQLVNTDDFQTNNKKSKSINWIKQYLSKDDNSIAIIDHHKLFSQIINTQ